MGLFKKPRIIQDEFFGSLRFIHFKDATKNYFEGRGYFAPTNSETDYLIQAGIEGPIDDQRQFYSNLQANFIQYAEKMKPLIENEFRNWKEHFEIKDFNREFKVVCVTIPRLDIRPLAWEIALTTSHDKNHQVTISFLDDKPNSIVIDG